MTSRSTVRTPAVRIALVALALSATGLVALATPAEAAVPADVLDLTRWKVTVPVDLNTDGNADEVKQPALDDYQLSPWFKSNAAGTAVAFRANTEGATTSGSDYPRSELREMAAGGGVAAWDSSAGVHIMKITQAIVALPSVKPHVVAGQIHNGADDVLTVRAERASGITRLLLEEDNGDTRTLDSNYVLGAQFIVKFKASTDGIKVNYWKSPTNSTPTMSTIVNDTGDNWFFKAGCYTQAYAGQMYKDKAVPEGTYGKVKIYGLSVVHRSS